MIPSLLHVSSSSCLVFPKVAAIRNFLVIFHYKINVYTYIHVSMQEFFYIFPLKDYTIFMFLHFAFPLRIWYLDNLPYFYIQVYPIVFHECILFHCMYMIIYFKSPFLMKTLLFHSINKYYYKRCYNKHPYKNILKNFCLSILGINSLKWNMQVRQYVHF